MQRPLSDEELVNMRKAGKVAACVLRSLKKFLKPGMTTKQIEKFFENYLVKYQGMQAAFLGFMGYPASLCVSINEEVIHGIPSEDKHIKNHDLVSIDLGIKYKDVFVDTAYTYRVANNWENYQIKKEDVLLKKKLIRVAVKALDSGVKHARIGAYVGEIGHAIQKYVEANGFSVVRKFVGHGIGRALHLPPEIPNFGSPRSGDKLKEGMAIAIEPMIAAGNFDVEVLSDGWTAKTKDNSLSAHFEHTVAITKKGPQIITN